ncbi:MAG TPA: ATP-binding protein [Bdellovibrionota bacterium]|nr:ATP-binding protein [Bdellovibrionota bacterium]
MDRKLLFTFRQLDLQAKISLLLVLVIVPTFIVVTIAQHEITQPILENDVRQIGITSAKTLASEIVSSRLHVLANPGPAIESRLQELLATQPSILRIDVALADPVTGALKTVASNIEEDPSDPPPTGVDAISTQRRSHESGIDVWEILVPIERQSRMAKAPHRRPIGVVQVVISVHLVQQLGKTLWTTTAAAAATSVVALILLLSYFLRKTIANDRRLRQAESQNLQLTEQLHETQRQLMNTEKLAVMGQLTASFAHEIGTPLNAIGGHLQLLREDLGSAPLPPVTGERLEIIGAQVSKIETIVKGFLQSTAKPEFQRQLVDVNRLADQTLGISFPRMDSLGVEVRRAFDRKLGPVRVVPLDLEQILLNLINNSLDSLTAKSGARAGRSKLLLEVATTSVKRAGKQWAEISVYDTGEGIQKADLSNVLKPFFTTKRPGEGTGLGLTICQQLARKYGGELKIDSKEEAWTRVTLSIPYQANA